MSQNYNIDDILEEVRRKKAMQADAPSTYESQRFASDMQGNERPTYSAPRDASGRGRTPPARHTSPGAESGASRSARQAPPTGAKRQAEPVSSPFIREPGAQQQRPARPPVNDYGQVPPADEFDRRQSAQKPRGEAAGRYAYNDDSAQSTRAVPPTRRASTPQSAPRPAQGRGERQGAARTSDSHYSPNEGRDAASVLYPSENDAFVRDQRSRNSESEPAYGTEFHDTQTENFAVNIDLDDDLSYADDEPQSQFTGHTGSDLIKSRWHQSFLEQEMMEQPVPDDDFGSPDDTPYVERDLKKLKIGLTVRAISMVFVTFLTAYLVLSIKYPPFGKLLGELYKDPSARLPLPFELIYPDKHPVIFMSVMLVLCIAGALICANIIGAGFGALFRLRANSDTPAALAILAVLIQGVVLIIYPSQLEEVNVSVYIPLAMLILLFTLFGKLMLTRRIEQNFRFLVNEKEKYAMLSIANRDFARELSRGLGADIDQVVYSARADFITGFLSKSYTGDYSDNFYCVSAPIGFLGAILIGVLTGLLSKNPVVAVSAFAGTMCICAPLSSAIVPHLMLGRMSKWLCKRGAMLAGYETAEEIAAAGAVVIDEKEVFPGDSVQLHGMKVFAEKRIDEAIMDAASVILSCNGLMSGVFLNMIGGNQRLLKKVDNLIYEEGMGVSAWVDGKRVLIGNRELMRTHEIECPSRDFETRYTKGGRRVLYISNSGELSAMFVVSYNGELRTSERLVDLERRGMAMVLYTTDPNVTSELVASVFGIRKGSVRVLPAKLHTEYNYLTRCRATVTAGSAHQGGLAGILQLMRASASVCHSVRTGAITQLIGIITGYGLMVALAFTNSLSLAAFHNIALYGLAAFAITTLLSNFGKM